MKGGDFRSREAERLSPGADQRQHHRPVRGAGRAFAREYGGMLDNRSFGGAQVSRTFYARGQTGQQLLLGAYQALERQIGLGTGEDVLARTKCSTLCVVDGQARGIVTRDLVTGKIETLRRPTPWCWPPADTATSSIFRPTPRAATPPPSGARTSAARCSPTRASRRFTRPASRSRGEYQSKLTLMSESLRNDGRIWVPLKKGDTRSPDQIPEAERDYFLERKYPSFGNLVPRDVASRNAKAVCDEGRGVGPSGLRCLSGFRRSDRSSRARGDRGTLRQPVRDV